eukprot:TRINITY_DN11140_c0_g1_i2.p1 TRINITY_DN11140_c0_g1~~TRINITY_DN11140_c0_g1_i2.p1  ORF type:complete len:324 (+),score=115.03 TRINITY_DN11140_c0_g1_i2:36-974(+)
MTERTRLTGGPSTKVGGHTLGNVLRVTVLMLGIFFYFLLVACIPRSKEIQDLNDRAPDRYRKGLYLTAVGSGIIEGCAVLLLVLAFLVHKSKIMKMTGIALMVLYTFGALLNMIGLGIIADETWNWDHENDTSYRSNMVGLLMGEASIAVAGLLVLLPDYGVLQGKVGHILRAVVLMLGIFFYFLLVACIPRSKNLDDYKPEDDFRKGLYLSAVGSGIIEGCAVLLLFIVLLLGCRAMSWLKFTGLALIVLYFLGALLNMIGVGMMTHESWDWKHPQGDASYRSQMVGTLMGEACIATAGVLVLLPDFGYLY